MFESHQLNDILKSELRLGNEISEETAWPPTYKKLVFLQHRFQQSYKHPELEFQVVDDPHYWYAEYADSDHQEILACK